MNNEFDESKKSDIPKWEPNHGTNESEKSYADVERTKKICLVSLIGVLAAMIMAICVGMIIGNIKQSGNSSNTSIQAAYASSDLLMLNMTNTNDISTDSGLGYYIADVSGIVEEVMPSVVSITSRSIVDRYSNGGVGIDDIFDYFFGGNGNNGNSNGNKHSSSDNKEGYEEEGFEYQEVDSGLGSGTIVAQNSSELLILTSFHVVENCSSLYVTFINDVSVDGFIKASDENNDIAVVAVPLEDIDKETINSIKIASMCPNETKVGEGVIVIGNPLGYGMSVTTGIVSAVNRSVTIDGKTLSLIQTDAAINSGNSGGCMLNSKGEIIGISEAKITVKYVEGMCYAIPIAENIDNIQILLNGESISKDEDSEAAYAEHRAYLGIRGADVTEDISASYSMPIGVHVSSVVPGSGAEEAGVLSGDVIVGIDDTIITTMEELSRKLIEYEPGDTVKLLVDRQINGEYNCITLDVTLTEKID